VRLRTTALSAATALHGWRSTFKRSWPHRPTCLKWFTRGTSVLVLLRPTQLLRRVLDFGRYRSSGIFSGEDLFPG
jgi:hypothetical protein